MALPQENNGKPGMKARIPSLFLWPFAYGAAAFLIGFLFGILRELVLIPAFGDRAGHLIEFPLVTGSVAMLGLWAGRRASPPGILIGLGGMAVLVLLESSLALAIMGQTLSEYLAHYEITEGALFPYGLAIMALAPILGKRSRPV